MTNELLARLRNDGSSWAQGLFNEAADKIEAMQSDFRAVAFLAQSIENEHLRAGVEAICEQHFKSE